MAKYAHKNLARFIKSDAKKIKSLNPDLKNTHISNVLSTYFGWRHFNELRINLDKDEILYSDKFQKISELNFEELVNLKSSYIRFIDKKFPQSKKDDDPYDIRNGGFLLFKNKKVTYIRKIENTPILDISLLHGETYIKLSNEETVNLLKTSLEISSFMQGEKFLNAILNALEKDPIDHDYFTSLRSFCRFDEFNKYFFNLKNKEDYIELEDYIYNIPGYIKPYYDNGKYVPFDEIEQNPSVFEEHGFIVIWLLYILHQPFLNPDARNKKVLNFREIKSYKGTIRVTYFEMGDIPKDLKLLSKLL